jgi:hypothetical protein
MHESRTGAAVIGGAVMWCSQADARIGGVRMHCLGSVVLHYQEPLAAQKCLRIALLLL